MITLVITGPNAGNIADRNSWRSKVEVQGSLNWTGKEGNPNSQTYPKGFGKDSYVHGWGRRSGRCRFQGKGFRLWGYGFTVRYSLRWLESTCMKAAKQHWQCGREWEEMGSFNTAGLKKESRYWWAGKVMWLGLEGKELLQGKSEWLKSESVRWLGKVEKSMNGFGEVGMWEREAECDIIIFLSGDVCSFQNRCKSMIWQPQRYMVMGWLKLTWLRKDVLEIFIVIVTTISMWLQH